VNLHSWLCLSGAVKKVSKKMVEFSGILMCSTSLKIRVAGSLVIYNAQDFHAKKKVKFSGILMWSLR